MTREEEIQDACKTSITETITCSGYGFTDRATDLLECAFEQGANWADETMIDKACEWLENNINDYLVWYDFREECRVNKDELLCNFKKAMKGGAE